MTGLVVDTLILALLLAALGFAVILHRRLKALQAGEPQLDELIGRLREVSEATGTVVESLRSEASEAAHRFAAERAAAQRLADELRLLTDRAERAAAGLAQGIRGARQPGAGVAATDRGTPADAAKAGAQRSRTELEQALNQLR